MQLQCRRCRHVIGEPTMAIGCGPALAVFCVLEGVALSLFATFGPAFASMFFSRPGSPGHVIVSTVCAVVGTYVLLALPEWSHWLKSRTTRCPGCAECDWDVRYYSGFGA